MTLISLSLFLIFVASSVQTFANSSFLVVSSSNCSFSVLISALFFSRRLFKSSFKVSLFVSLSAYKAMRPSICSRVRASSNNWLFNDFDFASNSSRSLFNSVCSFKTDSNFSREVFNVVSSLLIAVFKSLSSPTSNFAS